MKMRILVLLSITLSIMISACGKSGSNSLTAEYDSLSDEEKAAIQVVDTLPTTDPSEFYDSAETIDIEDVDTEEIEEYTNSVRVNIRINELKGSDNYSVEILGSWRDSIYNMDSYEVLINEESLYIISETEDGTILVKQNDYEEYLQLNEETELKGLDYDE